MIFETPQKKKKKKERPIRTLVQYILCSDWTILEFKYETCTQRV
jgi:hypothetical protein